MISWLHVHSFRDSSVHIVWAITVDINCTHLYGCCYGNPSELGARTLIQGWALALDTMTHVYTFPTYKESLTQHIQLLVYTTIVLQLVRNSAKITYTVFTSVARPGKPTNRVSFI